MSLEVFWVRVREMLTENTAPLKASHTCSNKDKRFNHINHNLNAYKNSQATFLIQF